MLALQEKLISLGYELGNAMGVWAVKKRITAVRNFQNRAKRMTDGVCDAAMRKLLD